MGSYAGRRSNCFVGGGLDGFLGGRNFEVLNLSLAFKARISISQGGWESPDFERTRKC